MSYLFFLFTRIYSEYKLVHITEGGCGTILLGSSGLPIKKIEAELNRSAADGWQMVFMVIEQKRFWLFWSREAAIITLGK
jgi:hypothetical protein